jgi:hypothetical protein
MDQLEDADAPPFALSETTRPLHLFDEKTITQNMSALTKLSASPENRKKLQWSPVGKIDMTASQASSSPPGLVESMMTEGSSSATDDSGVHEHGYSYHMGSSSNFLLSSLPTITSGIGSSSYLPNSHHAFAHREVTAEQIRPAERLEASGTFSQLMRAADVSEDVPLRQSRMQVVPENTSMEDSCAHSGALISAPPVQTPSPTRRESNNQWLPNVLSRSPRTGLEEPLLDTLVPSDEPILAASPSEAALQRARTSVQSFLEDDQTFEVSMEVPGPCTMQDVMNIIGNPELLRMWCDPVQSLVVTSASDRSGDSGMQRDDRREYEGEWIEATTTALESPPCHVGSIYSAGQAVCDALGFTSYGRITMFVERRRGQVGMTIGPFSGGIHASHTISVVDTGGRVRIVDRVRLTRDTEGASMSSLFLCGILDSCLLSSCLMPSLKAYMEQVSTSMARLRILVESGELSPETEIISAPQPFQFA